MGRARKVISRRPGRVVYKFPSISLRRMVYCESCLELDYAFLLDADHRGVLSFQEQPGKIKYFLDGKIHIYTPDFKVIRPEKKLIVEVKPKSKIFTKENIALFEAIRPICHSAGYVFVVINEDEIRVEPRLSNTKIFWKYGRTPIYPQHQIYCQEFFAHNRDSELGKLFEFFASRKEGRQVVFSLIYWGVVGIKIDNPISSSSYVYLPD